MRTPLSSHVLKRQSLVVHYYLSLDFQMQYYRHGPCVAIVPARVELLGDLLR